MKKDMLGGETKKGRYTVRVIAAENEQQNKDSASSGQNGEDKLEEVDLTSV